MKTCPWCGVEKPLDAFPRNSSRLDGRRTECKACHAAHKRELRATPEGRKKRQEVDRRHYLRHREKRLEYQRQYHREHQAERIARQTVYNHRRRRTKGEGSLTPAQWQEIVDFNDGLCVYCGAPYEHMDHVVPLALGGEHEPWNVAPACAQCNLSKGARDPIGWFEETFQLKIT